MQVLLLINQMDGSDAPAAAAKVSLLMLGQQAILDALLCLAHLTAGTPTSADLSVRLPLCTCLIMCGYACA